VKLRSGPTQPAPSLCALALGAWLAGGLQARAQPASGPAPAQPASGQSAAAGHSGAVAQGAPPAPSTPPADAAMLAPAAPPVHSARIARAAEPAQPEQSDDENSPADDAPDASETVPAAPMKSGPRTYTVRRGESLSILSQRFTGDPMGWPKLWALNPDIPNPNKIRPGQVIRVRGAGPRRRHG